MNWREYFAAIAPPWLSRYWGERLWGSLAYLSDLMSEGMSQAVKAHLLDQSTSPVDALPLIGLERRMPRYPGETNDSHRARLLDAWNAYVQGGTAAAITGQLATYGLDDVEIVSQHDGWVFENPKDTSQWSRFAVIIDGVTWGTSYVYGMGMIYGSAMTYGSDATPAETETIKSIVRKWKPVHSENPFIYVVLSGDIYGDPDLVYGAGDLYAAGEIVKWANDS